MREISCNCRNFRAAQNLTHCRNFRACAKFFYCPKFSASYFQPRTTPCCLFSFFALDVILLTWVFLVFHFIVRLYIAILYTVDLTYHWIEENTGALFLRSAVSLLFSHFLSLSRQPNTPLRMTTQGMIG